MSKPSLAIIQRFTYSLIAVIGITYVLHTLSAIILPLIFAALFAVFLLPVDRRMRKWQLPPMVGVFLSLMVVLVPSVLLFIFFGWQLSSLVETLPDISETLRKGLSKIEGFVASLVQLPQSSIDDSINDNIGSVVSAPLAAVKTGLVSTTTMLVGFGMTLIYTFLFLLYRKSFFAFLVELIDDGSRSDLNDLMSSIKDTVQSYVGGMGNVILILSVLNTLGLWLLGVQYPIFWGVMAAVLAIIPYVGTIIGSLLPVLFTLAAPVYPLQPLAIMVYFGVVQQLEGNFITPKIVGDRVDVNPLFAIIGVVAFSQLWGVAGAVLAIPLTALARIVLSHFDHLRPWSVLLSSEMYEEDIPTAGSTSAHSE